MTIVLLCSCALISAACGGSSVQSGTAPEIEPAETTVEASEKARPLPEPGLPLSAGDRYATQKFEPALSFRVGEGWQTAGPEIPDIFDIASQEGAYLIFNNPKEVQDPKKPTELAPMSEPKGADEWVAWFQSHPALDAGEETSVSVGGVSGTQFDVKVSSAPKDYFEECQAPCISVWPLSDGAQLYLEQGTPDRFTILDVGGETVIIDVSGPEGALSQAQEVLDTVEWETES